MTKVQYLPCAIMIISGVATWGYAFDGDLRRTVYWLSAAAITWSVTF